MEAVDRLDEIADLAGLEREGGLLELRDRLAAGEPVQVPALGCGAGILGILGGKLGEIGAAFDLLQEVFRFLLDGGGFGGGLVLRFEEDVAGANALRVAEAVQAMGLKYAVVTSVDRDDQADGGAGVFAETIRHIRQLMPETRIEVLIPDFKGVFDPLRTVLDAPSQPTR